MDGFLFVDKAGDMTSHDVVAMARKRLNTKRVGHAGTLDPMATGVLVLGVGVATRLLPYITDGKKAYLGTISLGKTTHTDDKQGNVIFTAPNEIIQSITDEQISNELEKYIGKIKQKPSAVSAIKISGKSAHARVRAGESINIPEREVEIYSINIKSIRHQESEIQIDIEVECSAGTYIRAVARDLGNALNCGGHLSSLIRTLVSPFSLEKCQLIDDAQLVPISSVIDKIFMTRVLTEAQKRNVLFGRSIDQNATAQVVAALDSDQNFVALLENKMQAQKIMASPILVNSAVAH
jgi:tRNA pseudouridine55 synthase